MAGGRPVGSKTNPDEKSFRNACKRVFIKLNRNDKWLETVAKEHPVDFLKLMGSLEPKQIGLDNDTIKSLASLAQELASV